MVKIPEVIPIGPRHWLVHPAKKYVERKKREMDATTLQDVAQQTEQLALGDAVLLAKGNMKICQLKYQGKAPSLKLGHESQNTTVAFEPSVYNGTGEEIRKGVVFCIGDEDYGGMAALEE